MSLRSAKAIPAGILFQNSVKQILLVPLRITTLQITDSTDYKPSNTFEVIYQVLLQKTKKYTIFIEKKSQEDFEIILYLYFSSEQDSLQKVTKNTIKHLVELFAEVGFKLTLIDADILLKKLQKKIPLNIEEILSSVYQITTQSYSYYLTLALFKFKESPDKEAFLSFMKDFKTLVRSGSLILDITNELKKIKDERKLIGEATISIKIEDSKLDSIKRVKKTIDSLIAMFSKINDRVKNVDISYVNSKEITNNFGKVILGQGWHSVIADYDDLLDLETIFNLLKEKK